jgi:hypothetical protein
MSGFLGVSNTATATVLSGASDAYDVLDSYCHLAFLALASNGNLSLRAEVVLECIG